ncbi:helix-turn-helix transcriptional regulator [Frankia sp. Cr2]|uniref:helix-turn-helix transcriptional regulator n=1 Tax=Frankia sp. Cr2 TaxID=3073932 RepID=UPI002AD420A7|nr:AAA family ATPase [Frankia sp. Cr2]
MGGLVGRGSELALLQDALERARSGQGSVVSISGEPGVGKTALCRAFAEMVASTGARVLWGACFQGQAQPSYGPWVDAMAQLGGIDIGTGQLNPREARLRVFASAHDTLASAGGGTGTVVVIDDLHWATADSLELYGYVAARAVAAGIVLIGTYRDPDPAVSGISGIAGIAGDTALVALLGSLVRIHGYLDLRLRGLDPTGVGRYLARTFGETGARGTGARSTGGDEPAGTDEVPPAVVRAVHEHTAGNPFYVREVARGLVEDGKLVRRDGRWLSDTSVSTLGIPATVRQAVRARVGGLAPATRSFLQAAAVFSGDLRLATVGAVAELSEAAALDAVDQALATGFLRRTANVGAPYAFAHAIVRDALADSINPDRAARLHRRAADVLEGEQPTDHAAVAEQYLRSRALPGAERGVVHCLHAAASASRDHAHGQAVRLLGNALDLLPAGAGNERAEVLRRLAVAQAEALDGTRAPETTRRALTLLDAVQGAELVVHVVDALREGAPASAWEPLVGDGLRLVGDDRNLTWARLAVAVDPVDTVESGETAWVRVGRWREYPADAVALLRAHGGEDDQARSIEPFQPRTVEQTQALLARVHSWSSPRAVMRGLDLVGRDFTFRHGRITVATDCYRELLAVGERVGSVVARSEACSQLALCTALAGDVAAAHGHLERAFGLVEGLWSGHRRHLLGTVSHAVILGYVARDADWSGLGARLGDWLRGPLAAKAPFANAFVALAALCHAFAGERDTARARLRDVAGLLARMSPHDHSVAGMLWFGIATAWELGDPEAAGWLAPALDRHRTSGGPPGPMGSTEHGAGRVAALLGDRIGAAEQFAVARHATTAGGGHAVRALVDVDDAIVRADPMALDTALRALDRRAMPGWAAWARSADHQARAGAGRRTGRGEDTSTRPRPAGLTPREVEVLGLLAAGRTSKEIAADLVLSLLTVNRHVANIYTKIGARNRAEATAFAIAHGLSAEPANRTT